MRWRSTILGLSAVTFMFAIGPSLFKDLGDGRKLEEGGRITTGTVIRHYQLPGTRGCRGRVEVAFEADHAQHLVSATWCGEGLTGRPVDVKYLPSEPAVSEVIAPALGIKSERCGLGMALLLASIAVGILFAAYSEWRKGR
jgi:hypothetical protein